MMLLRGRCRRFHRFRNKTAFCYSHIINNVIPIRRCFRILTHTLHIPSKQISLRVVNSAIVHYEQQPLFRGSIECLYGCMGRLSTVIRIMQCRVQFHVLVQRTFEIDRTLFLLTTTANTLRNLSFKVFVCIDWR